MKKLVVITGAGGGIGEALKEQFKDHPLLLLGRNLAVSDLGNHLTRKVDVTDFSGLQHAIKEAEAKFGPTDLLINNAGVMLLGTVAEQLREQWTTMLNINIIGVLNGMQAVLPEMIKRNEGTIINVSSIAGRKTFPNHAVYCASKFGVHALSENTRAEVASSNVRISVIAPGVVETKLLYQTTDQKMIEGYEQWKAGTISQGLKPSEVAKAACFIYSMPQDVCIRELVLAPTKQDL